MLAESLFRSRRWNIGVDSRDFKDFICHGCHYKTDVRPDTPAFFFSIKGHKILGKVIALVGLYQVVDSVGCSPYERHMYMVQQY